MKKFKTLSIAVIFSAVVLTTGCNSSDPDFEIFGYGWVIQNVDDISGTPVGYETFTPFLFFEGRYGEIAKGSIMAPDNVFPMRGTLYGGVLYETSYDYSGNQINLNAINGYYTFSAESTDGKVATYQFPIRINEDKILGPMEVLEFEYTNDKKITAKIEKVENAVKYGFYMQFENDGEFNSFSFGGFLNQYVDAGTGDVQDVVVSYDTYDQIFEKIRVYPVAFYEDSNSSRLVRYGQYKTLKRGLTSFEED